MLELVLIIQIMTRDCCAGMYVGSGLFVQGSMLELDEQV